VQKKLIAEVSADFSELSRSAEFARRMRKSLALVIGLRRHDDYYIHNIKYAHEDARDFYNFLVDPKGGAVPKKNVSLLLNERATLANIRSAMVDFLAKRSLKNDTVLVYFAGYGGIEGPEGKLKKYLIPYDAKAKDLAKSALSLDELAKLLKGITAREIIVIVDGSFGGNPLGRSYRYQAKGTGTPAPVESFPKLIKLADDPRVSILFSSDEGQMAAELDDARHGLFTFFLLEGLRGKADKDKDGDITVAEMADYLSAQVAKRAVLEGFEQSPLAGGKNMKKALVRERPGKVPARLPAPVEEGMEAAKEPTPKKLPRTPPKPAPKKKPKPAPKRVPKETPKPKPTSKTAPESTPKTPPETAPEPKRKVIRVH
jgi:uncharacterized caspase-like protein